MHQKSWNAGRTNQDHLFTSKESIDQVLDLFIYSGCLPCLALLICLQRNKILFTIASITWHFSCRILQPQVMWLVRSFHNSYIHFASAQSQSFQSIMGANQSISNLISLLFPTYQLRSPIHIQIHKVARNPALPYHVYMHPETNLYQGAMVQLYPAGASPAYPHLECRIGRILDVGDGNVVFKLDGCDLDYVHSIAINPAWVELGIFAWFYYRNQLAILA